MCQKAYSDIQSWQRGKAGWRAGACVERRCAWAGHSPGLWKAFHQRFPQGQSEGRKEKEVQTMLMVGWKEHWEGCWGEEVKKGGKHKLTCYSHVEAKEGNKKKWTQITRLMSWNWGTHIHVNGQHRPKHIGAGMKWLGEQHHVLERGCAHLRGL